MNSTLSRRRFLRQTSVLATAAAAHWQTNLLLGADEPHREILVGVMGLSRGQAHINALLSLPGVRVAYICDVDRLRLQSAQKQVVGKQSQPAKAVTDFRAILDDPSVDALTVATPNFWHAPATILACQAGKHVYVEKPASHNAQEAEWIVAAARKHRRLVQMGNQRRSWPAIIEMMHQLRSGIVGPVRSARCYYSSTRGSIGQGQQVAVPENLDWPMWQGPAPERPYVDNLVHYNWHWRWHWGGGELANNGVHALDLARWGLGVDYPRSVSYTGGRYHYQDDQETPDTAVAAFDFGETAAFWDHSSCFPRKNEALPFVAFYGPGGTVANFGGGYQVFDETGKETMKVDGEGGDRSHFANFIEAIRDDAKLNSPIEEGQKSTMLCHLGNIAYRSSTTLVVDPQTGRLQNGTPEALRLWEREYRPGWKPSV